MARTEDDLTAELERIDHRGYPAYKDLRGTYDLGGIELSIDHVQGDPFAAPSKLSVRIPARVGCWPRRLSDEPHRTRALEDFLMRRWSRSLARASRVVGGSGKSGVLGTDRPGPEVLSRTGLCVDEDGVTARFEAGFPAHGRSCDARGLARILLDIVPDCVDQALVADDRTIAQAQAAADLADDQHFIRGELERLDLVAFVADGAVLPRASGVSSAPMSGAVPFRSPDTMAVTLALPHRGEVRGMAIRRGVTLVVGGGYHGKSTLLKALQEGVYDHVAGDGRELVICDASAWKLRAEDGRPVRDADISPFIGNLPSGQDTCHFSTDDASGSTSQAASAVEALAMGARTLLIDEDTSATNFMVRDRLMEAVVSRDQEPITPFVERVRDLWEKAGVSSVIVAGSSGSFFSVADAIVQMDRYRALDVTDRARETCERLNASETPQAAGFALPDGERPCRLSIRDARAATGRGRGRGGRPDERREARALKAKALGTDEVRVGDGMADLRLVEQLIDPEQVTAIARLVALAAERGLLDGPRTSVEVAGRLVSAIERDGWEAVLGRSHVNCGMALPRTSELAAALFRWR